MRTLPIALATFQSTYETNYGLLMAGGDYGRTNVHHVLRIPEILPAGHYPWDVERIVAYNHLLRDD
jgi:hypothetical protein